MKADIIINDLSGRVILRKVVTVIKGNNKFNINLSGLQKGIYIAKLQGPEMEFNSKLVLE